MFFCGYGMQEQLVSVIFPEKRFLLLQSPGECACLDGIAYDFLKRIIICFLMGFEELEGAVV